MSRYYSEAQWERDCESLPGGPGELSEDEEQEKDRLMRKAAEDDYDCRKDEMEDA